MQVMPSNNSGLRVGYLCKSYPERLGWLISPGGWRQPPSWMPTALDNGAYGAYINKKDWNEDAWWKLLNVACKSTNILWAVVPDVVANREATIMRWHKYAPLLMSKYPNLPLAFAVQDGMTPADVPVGVHTVFVGGSFDWKWANIEMWTSNFPRVHIAKVNSAKRLWQADQAGAVSCDGTGWFQYGDAKIDLLTKYLETSSLLPKHEPRSPHSLGPLASLSYNLIMRNRHNTKH